MLNLLAHGVLSTQLPAISLLIDPDYRKEILDIGDVAIIVRPKVQMRIYYRGAAIGTNMDLRKIERQKLVGASSDTLKIFGFGLNLAAGMSMREISYFAIIHGLYICP
jgi:hypothetical protein